MKKAKKVEKVVLDKPAPAKKLTPLQVAVAALLAKISELKGQDANGHKVTPLQLDELAQIAGGVSTDSGGGPGEEQKVGSGGGPGEENPPKRKR